MNRNDFIINEKASRDTIDVKRAYIMMAGDHAAGVLLSQIVYWHLPDKEGNPRLTIKRNDHLWLAKKRDDWWDEICMLPKQFDRAIKDLENRELVKTELFRFDGSPTKHIRLNWDMFLQVYEAIINDDTPSFNPDNPEDGKWIFPIRENGNSRLGNMDTPEQGISQTPRKPTPAVAPTIVENGPEITTETTTDINKDSSDFDKSDVLFYVQSVVDFFNSLKSKYPDKIEKKVNRPKKQQTVETFSDKRYRAILKWYDNNIALPVIFSCIERWIKDLPKERKISGINYFENYNVDKLPKPYDKARAQPQDREKAYAATRRLIERLK